MNTPFIKVAFVADHGNVWRTRGVVPVQKRKKRNPNPVIMAAAKAVDHSRRVFLN